MTARIRLLVCALSILAAYACESGSDTTTGREVTLHTVLEAEGDMHEPFVTASGWSVTLSKAFLSVGAFYYFDGEPAFVLRRRPSLLRQLAGLFSASIAHAHPGHYVSGSATAQMTTPQATDLAVSATFPDASGVTGLYRSARLVLAEASEDMPELEGNVALVEGLATKGEQRVHFRLSASFADVARSVRNGQVDGCVFEEAQVQGDGTVTASVRPSVWFNLVDFADVEPGSSAAPTEIVAGTKTQRAFALGVVQLSAYHFSYHADE